MGLREVIGVGQVIAVMERWLPLFFFSYNSMKVSSNDLEYQCRLGRHKHKMKWEDCGSAVF